MKFISILAVTAATSYANQQRVSELAQQFLNLESCPNYKHRIISLKECPTNRPPGNSETWQDIQGDIDRLQQNIDDKQQKILDLDCTTKLDFFNNNAAILALGKVVDPRDYLLTESQLGLENLIQSLDDQIFNLTQTISTKTTESENYFADFIQPATEAFLKSKYQIQAAADFQKILSANGDDFDAMQTAIDVQKELYKKASEAAKLAMDNFGTIDSLQNTLTDAEDKLANLVEDVVKATEDVTKEVAFLAQLKANPSSTADEIKDSENDLAGYRTAESTAKTFIRAAETARDNAKRAFDQFAGKLKVFTDAFAEAAAQSDNFSFVEKLLDAQKDYRETYLAYAGKVTDALSANPFDLRLQTADAPTDDDFQTALDNWFQSSMAVKELTKEFRSINLTDLCTVSAEYKDWRSTNYPIDLDRADITDCGIHPILQVAALDVIELTEEITKVDLRTASYIITQIESVSKMSSSQSRAIENFFKNCVCLAKATEEAASGVIIDPSNVPDCEYDDAALSTYSSEWNFDVEKTCGAVKAPYDFWKKYSDFSQVSSSYDDVFDTLIKTKKDAAEVLRKAAQTTCETVTRPDKEADYLTKKDKAVSDLALAVTELTEAKSDLKIKQVDFDNYSDPIAFRTLKSKELVIKQEQLAKQVAEIDTLTAELTGVEADDTAKQAKIDAKTETKDAFKDVVTELAKLVRNLSNSNWVEDEQKAKKEALETAQSRFDTAVKDEVKAQETDILAKMKLYQKTDKGALSRLIRDEKSKFDNLIKIIEPVCEKAIALELRLQTEVDIIRACIAHSKLYRDALQAELDRLEGLACQGIFYDEAIDLIKAQIEQVKLDIKTLQDSLDDYEDSFGVVQDGLLKRLSIAEAAIEPACRRPTFTNFEYNPISCDQDDFCDKQDWWCNKIPTFDFEKPCISDQSEFVNLLTNLQRDIYDVKAIQEFNKKMACAKQDLRIPEISLPLIPQPPKLPSLAPENLLPIEIANLTKDLVPLNAQLAKAKVDFAKIDGVQYWIDAADYVACEDRKAFKTPSYLDQIRGWSEKIAEELIFQSTKFDSYWPAFKQISKDQLDNLKTKKSDVEDALTAGTDAFKAVFPIATLTEKTIEASDVPASSRRLSTSLDKRQLSDRRQLADYTSDDLQMLDSIKKDDRFSKITACTKVNDSTSVQNIVGFQSYFGTGSGRQAGPAHGDNVNGCQDFTLSKPVKELQLYFSKDDATILEGMQFVLQDSAPTTIKIGEFPLEGQTRKSKTWESTDDLQFFGFKTTADDSSYLFSAAEVVEYDLPKFSQLKDDEEQIPKDIAAEEENIRASDEAAREWEQIAVYEQVIVSSLVADLQMVTPQVFTIDRPLYPEEAVRQQAQIDAQVLLINEEWFQVDSARNTAVGVKDEEIAEQRKIYGSQIQTLSVTEEAYAQHVNQDDVDDGQIGAVVAVIIGGVLLVVLAIYLLMQLNQKRQAGKRAKTLVGQSSFRSDSQTPGPNEI